MDKRTCQGPPTFVAGRKGRTSTVDSIVACLWVRRTSVGDEWPELSFAELRTAVEATQGYSISSSTIRSAIYGRTDLFERSTSRRVVRWRLTPFARQQPSESPQPGGEEV